MSRLARSFAFLSFGAVAYGVVLQPYRMIRITGISMEPTYHDGDFALTVQSPTSVKDGDVVVVDTEDGPIVKRVVRVPGDRYLEANVGVAGWTEVCMPLTGKPPTRIKCRWRTVPPDCIYVLGDNLPCSVDSRSIGTLHLSQVRSKLLNQKPHQVSDYAWLPSLPHEA
jgi:signal peptidase I